MNLFNMIMTALIIISLLYCVAKSPRNSQSNSHGNKKISEYFSKFSYSPRSNTGSHTNSKWSTVDGSCQTELSGSQIEVSWNL